MDDPYNSKPINFLFSRSDLDDSAYGPERAGDVRHSLASIEKASTLLGYAPTHDFKQGLAACVRWYWEHLKP
jgi:UDP-N-acetylglucosamine 4-epimerase